MNGVWRSRAGAVLLVAAAMCASTATDAQWVKHRTAGIPRTSDGKPDLTAPAPRMVANLRQGCARFVRGLRRRVTPSSAERAVGDAPMRHPLVGPPLAAAERRARDLLLRMLSGKQRREFELCGCFSVEAPGRGRFWILPWRSLNVVEPVTGDCYCGIPEGRLPVYDLMLAQKLLLENDPKHFFLVANRHPNFVQHPRNLRAGAHMR